MRERLTQEYKSHLEEHLATGGNEDAEALFGSPKTVKKNLQKLYIELKIFQLYGTQKDWGFWFFLSVDSLILIPLSQNYTKCLIVFLLKLSCYICLWISTIRFPSERRWVFRNIPVYGILAIPFFPADSIQNGLISHITIALLQLAGFVYLTRMTDLKLRRTLDLERPIRERPYLGLYVENQT